VPSFTAHFTPCTEVSWRLQRDQWGHGYATEAARACLHFAFATLRLPEVVSFTVPDNLRSRRVMERLGMRRRAGEDFEHPRLPPGHPLRPHVLYRLARADFASGAGLSPPAGG
jgi:RimJ/RimL family protein N-acetyltransferase